MPPGAAWRPGGGRLAAPWALLLATLRRRARAGLTAFELDPTEEGILSFQEDVLVPEQFLESDNGTCGSIDGPHCTGLHGPPTGADPGGVFGLFGSLPGDPGFFVQDEVGSYFPAARGDEEEGRVRPNPAAASPPATCARLGFEGLPPHATRLPQRLRLGGGVSVEFEGTFAVATRQPEPRRTGPGRWPWAHAEVQSPVAYLRFSEPVVVERIWLSREASRHGRYAEPVVLRGRRGPDEQWSVYLLHSDLRGGWASPARIAPLPVQEVVVLGGQGLRIASVHASHARPAREGGAPGGSQKPRPRGPAGRNGWLLQPAEVMRSLRDLGVSKLPLPSAAAAYSVAEAHRSGQLRLRADLLREAPPPRADADEEELDAQPEVDAKGERRFVDGRTVGGMRALVEALQTGAMLFPRDVPLPRLEADVRLYGDVFGQVTLEEAVNARSFDELYEQLFLANRMDALDLLFLKFLWANHTQGLRAPGGAVAEGGNSGRLPAAEPEPGLNGSADASASGAADDGAASSPLAALDAGGKRRRAAVANLRRHTSAYTRWKRPIDDKVAFLNESGAVDVTFALLDNVSLLHVDFYNAASGRGGNFEIAVPDAEYLLAELLGIEQDLLVDHRGRPLPDARAARMHRERSYRAQFAEVLEELRRQTSEDGGALPLDELDAEDSAEDFEPRVAGQDHPQAGSHLPPLPVAVAVPCVVVGVVLLAALAPPLGRVRERAAALLGVGRRAPP